MVCCARQRLPLQIHPPPSRASRDRESLLRRGRLTPDHLELLEEGYLSGLDQFQVQTLNTYEDLLNNSIRVDYETSGYVTVDRPDKIRIERYGLEMHQLFYFNGNEFTLHNPYEKVYASEAHSGDIEDMFHLVRDTYGLSAPSADLIYPNTFELLMQNVNGAKVIGK